ncbi:MAG TPA: L-fucose:H+ symporter permease [Bryobacteraceae bacterium]|nr:L-fucose:H+ symporter permease [Bryobacteraceae bacterium]
MPSNYGSVSPSPAATEDRAYGVAMAAVTTVFFMWGFVTVLNDILVPHLKSIFELNYAQIMLIQFTFFSAYFLMSMPAAKVIARLGYQGSIVLGLVVMGAGALLFDPAASAASYGLFLLALWVLASGITLLQVAANPYVAVLGPPKGASSRLNLAQAFNSLGTALAPYVGGALILSNVSRPVASLHSLSPDQLQAYRTAEASTVKLPYVAIALALFLLAFAISRFRLPVLAAIESRHDGEPKEPLSALWKHRHLVLGALGIFLYVGAEVSIGSFLVNYFSQPDIGALTERAAAGYVSFYWTGAMIGRFIGSAALHRAHPGKALGTVAIVASLLVCTSILTSGHVAMWTIILVGLFNSIMFPNIFTLGISGLGKLTGQGSGILVMAIVGGAIIPIAQGALADRIGIHMAFILPALCYLYVAYYGFVGQAISNQRSAIS